MSANLITVKGSNATAVFDGSTLVLFRAGVQAWGREKESRFPASSIKSIELRLAGRLTQGILRVFAPGGTSAVSVNPSTELSTLTFAFETNAQAQALADALETARTGAWGSGQPAAARHTSQGPPAQDAAGLVAERAKLLREVLDLRDLTALQEVGVYEYQHPLDDAEAYKVRLLDLRGRIKRLVAQDRAVSSTSTWTVNGSQREGEAMLKDLSKLMLRAYNAEVDAAARSVRPHVQASTLTRIDKTVETIAKLGASMQIRVSHEYHTLRRREVILVADHHLKVNGEKG